jgi:hypothetical protein
MQRHFWYASGQFLSKWRYRVSVPWDPRAKRIHFILSCMCIGLQPWPWCKHRDTFSPNVGSHKSQTTSQPRRLHSSNIVWMKGFRRLYILKSNEFPSSLMTDSAMLDRHLFSVCKLSGDLRKFRAILDCPIFLCRATSSVHRFPARYCPLVTLCFRHFLEIIEVTRWKKFRVI